jgi:hypothetical protein
LNAMPNTAVKLVYALRNFSTNVADKINADSCEAKWKKIDGTLDAIALVHQETVAKIRQLKEGRAAWRGMHDLKQTVVEGVSSLRSRSPNSQQNEQLANAF